MDKTNHLLLFFSGALFLVLVFGLLVGTGGLTGLPTASANTVTSITLPADGASYKKGESFTVSAVIACEGSKCNNVKATLSATPSGLGISGAIKSLSSISAGRNKAVTWLVAANTLGNYSLTVSTTSSNAKASLRTIKIVVFTPVCLANSDCGASGYTGGNYCALNGSVYKDYRSVACQNPGTIGSNCQITTTPILQSNCGTPGFVGPNYCIGDNVYRNYKNTGCESGFCTNSTSAILVQTCINGCSNGQCVQATPDSCADNDGGYNTASFGTISGSQNNFPYSYGDYCMNQSILVERYCNGNSPANASVNCQIGNATNSTGCSLGSCA